MSVFFFLLPPAIAAVLAFVLTPASRAFASRLGAVDRPGPRKIHETPVPRLGGLAVVLAVVGALSLTVLVGGGRVRIIPANLLLAAAAGLLPIFIVSLLDDIRPLRPMPKFLVHLAAASATVALGVRLGPSVHVFHTQISIGWLAVPISVLWLAGITNAFNIIDGLDGLSAGLALISAVSLACVSLIIGRYEMATTAAILAGALAGFLPFNIYPAKVYLGDTGATAIGFFLGVLTLRGGSTATAGMAVILPVLAVSVPLAETILSMVRRGVRKLQGSPRGILDADRDHIHHRLIALGYTHRRAVVLLYGVGVVVALCGFASVYLTEQNAALLLVTLFAAAMAGVAKLGYDEFAIIRSGAVLRVYNKPVLRSGLFVVFIDLALVTAAIYTAIVLKYDDWSVRDHRQLAINLLVFAPAVTVAIFGAMGIYRRSWSNAGIDDMLRASVAVLIAAAGAMMLIRLLTDAAAPLTFFAVYTVVLLGFVDGSRASYRVLSHWNRRSSQAGQPVVIYGAGHGGTVALREILENDDVAMKPVGFIDDDPLKHGRLINGYPVLGDVDDLENIVTGSGINGVVVSSEKIPISKLRSARRICDRNGAWLTFFEVNFRRPSEPLARRREM